MSFNNIDHSCRSNLSQPAIGLHSNPAMAEKKPWWNSEKMHRGIALALKTSSVILIGSGIAASLGAAVYTWPKITSIIVSTVKGTNSSQHLKIAEGIAELCKVFFHALAACAEVGGDIGGFCALFVISGGIAVLIAPVALTYGVPIIPGILLCTGGGFLWGYAKSYEEDHKILPP